MEHRTGFEPVSQRWQRRVFGQLDQRCRGLPKVSHFGLGYYEVVGMDRVEPSPRVPRTRMLALHHTPARSQHTESDVCYNPKTMRNKEIMNIETLSKPCNQSDLAIAARREILESILPHRPEAVSDLWDTALEEFESLVFERFENKLMKSWERHRADCARAPHLYGDFKAAVIHWELKTHLDAPIPSRVVNVVRDAFPSWVTLTESVSATRLCDSIMAWSRRWALDSNWCRDHALSVLRHWLDDDDFEWAKLYPSLRSRVEFRGWKGSILWS
jgi:hypothetical protein